MSLDLTAPRAAMQRLLGATKADRSIDLIPWALATLLIAGIVHLVSILLMPAVAPDDALARLSRHVAQHDALAGGGEGVVLLPPIRPGAQILPNEDPAFEEAVCVYDLGKGPLRVTATADGEDFLGVSFHANAGRIYHAMTDRSAIRGKIDIVIGDAEQIDSMETSDEDAPTDEIRLRAPTRRGFVLIRSFAKRASDHARARERLASVKCERVEMAR